MSDQFEGRLRSALHRAARQLEVPPVAWRGPVEAPRHRRVPSERLPVMVGVGVAVIVVVVVVALIGLRHHVSPAAGTSATLPKAPASAFEPHLTPSELGPIAAAQRRVVAGDASCRGFQGPNLAHGQPGPELTSLFSLLREPASSGVELRSLLERDGRAWSPGAQLYINQIHRVRSAFGGAFYILPAGNVTGQRGVPARCQAEEVTALKWELARTKPALQDRIFAGQRRYFAYMGYLAAHPEGICATWLGRDVNRLSAGTNFMCGGLANFERWGIMADDSSHMNGHPVFWTVVPDVVGSVTLRFDGGGTPQPRLVTMTVRPVNDVVVAVVPHGRVGSSGSWADTFPSAIVLRNRAGQVIRSYMVTPNMPTLCGFSC